MKKIFTFMAVCALTLAANAQTMSAGFDAETKSIDVNLKNDDVVTSLSFKFLLPEGVTVTTETEDDETYELWAFDEERVKDSKTKKWSTDIRPALGGATMVTCYGGPGIKAGEGPIFHIPVEGTLNGEVKFYDAQVFMGSEIQLPEFTLALSGDAINSISAEQTKSGVIYNMAGQRVSKATKGIFIVDGKKVAVK